MMFRLIVKNSELRKNSTLVELIIGENFDCKCSTLLIDVNRHEFVIQIFV